MNVNTKNLIRYVCDGDIKKAQDQARLILANDQTAANYNFKKEMLRKLDIPKKEFITLPANLQGILVAENVSKYPSDRFYQRECERRILKELKSVYKAAGRLQELGISYASTAIFYGDSGTGKTSLARVLAHELKVPFVYIRFSALIDSLMGSTQKNVARIFDYARQTPCVLCFDEIDAVGTKRGNDSISEMNRVVISLMQEMDNVSNDMIIIGTTNCYDRLDPALVRRFHHAYEIPRFTNEDALCASLNYLQFVGITEFDRKGMEDYFNSLKFVRQSGVFDKLVEELVSYCSTGRPPFSSEMQGGV